MKSIGKAQRGTVCALIVLLSILMVWCANAPAQTTPSPSPTGSVLRIGWLEDPESLNPFVAYNGSDYEIFHLNYDYLVGFEATTAKPRPEFAESWTQSADGLTWTFKIRRGMTWQDGRPATARDVAFTYNYIIDNHMTMFTSYTDGITSVKALDDYTVQIRTAKPKANMLTSVIPILPEHIWSKVNPKSAGSDYAPKVPMVGSGPFQVVEWKHGSFVRLKANSTYWRGEPAVKEIIFTTYTNPSTMVEDLKLGELDGAVGIPRAQFASLASNPGLATNKAEWLDFYHLGFNCYDGPGSKGNPVLLDERFRQALQWAVDRQKAVDLAVGGYGVPGSTIITPPSSPYHWTPPADQTFTYDPAKAKSLLEAAGYKDVNGDGYRETPQGKPLTLRLFANVTTPDSALIGKLVVGWFKAVGVKVQLTTMGDGPMVDAIFNYQGQTYAPDYDMYIWYWTGDVDPTNVFVSLLPRNVGQFSLTQWTDPEYTKLYGQFTTELNYEKRVGLADQMQSIVYNSSPFIVFYYPYSLEAYNTDRWSGWTRIGSHGPVIFAWYNVDTYMNLKPAAAAATTDGSSSLGVILALVVAVVVIAVVVAVIMTRRGRRTVEE